MTKPPTKDDLRREIEASFDVLELPGAAPLSARDVEGAIVGGGHVHVALDSEGRWHLLIPVEGHVGSDRKSRGVHVGPRQLVDRGATRDFVQVTCLDGRLRRLFGILASEMIDRVLTADVGAEEAVLEVLEEWRSLLERAGRAVDENTLRGLFAELSVLRRLLAVDPAAVTAWRGPDGERHDFRRGGLAIEAKAVRRPTRVVTINGVEQLEEPEGGELVLVVHVVDSDQTGRNLAELVDELVGVGADREVILDGLAKLGVDPDSEAVTAARFSQAESSAYAVRSGFPRLIRSDLASGHLHPAIRSLTYSVDLSSAEGDRLDDAQLATYETRLVQSS